MCLLQGMSDDRSGKVQAIILAGAGGGGAKPIAQAHDWASLGVCPPMMNAVAIRAFFAILPRATDKSIVIKHVRRSAAALGW